MQVNIPYMDAMGWIPFYNQGTCFVNWIDWKHIPGIRTPNRKDSCLFLTSSQQNQKSSHCFPASLDSKSTTLTPDLSLPYPLQNQQWPTVFVEIIPKYDLQKIVTCQLPYFSWCFLDPPIPQQKTYKKSTCLNWQPYRTPMPPPPLWVFPKITVPPNHPF